MRPHCKHLLWELHFSVSSSHVGSGIVPVDRVSRISYGHSVYHALPFYMWWWWWRHASSFTSLFFLISFSACFFQVCFGLPLLLLTSNFKAFIITFSSFFLKIWSYHRILRASAILSKDFFMLTCLSTPLCFFYL